MNVLDGLQAAVYVLDRGLRVDYANQHFCKLLQVDSADLTGRAVLDVFDESPERRQILTDLFTRALAGDTVELERQAYSIADPDGVVRERIWNIRAAPIHEDDGTIALISVVAEEKTAEVAAEQMRDAVAAELQHRIANMIALIGVIARRTFGEMPEANELTKKFIARLGAMAETNRMLTGNNWDGTTFMGLAQRHLAEFQDNSGRIRLDGPDLHLDSATAQSVSMALHELGTNAAKHGVLGNGGKLSVTWDKVDDNGFWFEWREDGDRPLPPPGHNGFGTTLLTRVLPLQLSAEVAQSFEGASHRYRLTVKERPASAE